MLNRRKRRRAHSYLTVPILTIGHFLGAVAWMCFDRALDAVGATYTRDGQPTPP